MNFKEGVVLYFDKPLRWTSFDLVNRIRRIITRSTGEKIKVGHAGCAGSTYVLHLHDELNKGIVFNKWSQIVH